VQCSEKRDRQNVSWLWVSVVAGGMKSVDDV